VASLVGILVQVGLLLVAMLLMVLTETKGVAGGILVGAGILGLSLRLVRIAQLIEEPSFDPAVGSWVDLVGEASVLIAGGLSLTSLETGHVADEGELEDLEDLESELPPPSGEGA
jgi:hypothetical protein